MGLNVMLEAILLVAVSGGGLEMHSSSEVHPLLRGLNRREIPSLDGNDLWMDSQRPGAPVKTPGRQIPEVPAVDRAP